MKDAEKVFLGRGGVRAKERRQGEHVRIEGENRLAVAAESCDNTGHIPVIYGVHESLLYLSAAVLRLLQHL